MTAYLFLLAISCFNCVFVDTSKKVDTTEKEVSISPNVIRETSLLDTTSNIIAEQDDKRVDPLANYTNRQDFEIQNTVRTKNKNKPLPSKEATPTEVNEEFEDIEIETNSTLAKSDEYAENISNGTEAPSEVEIKKQDLDNLTSPVAPVPEIRELFSFNHSSFDSMCRMHISQKGRVNYRNWKSEESKLDEYLAKLSNNPPSPDWSHKESLAFWINTYNAFTIKLILKNYPVKSIVDLEGGKPWDVKWIKIGPNTYSLNNIEHDIIRPTYQEPRIHFAVNCAALSCPPLKTRAYTSDNLETMLESATTQFINNSNYNSISVDGSKLSKIFEWYGEDFGDIKAYINKYSKEKISQDSHISFLEYDWSLNGE